MEGEACFDMRDSAAKVRDPDNKQCRIIVEMKDEDILLRLQGIFGGTVREVKCKSKVKEGWATYYKWLLSSREDVLFCLQFVQPFMGIRRREKIALLVTFLEKKLENR
jgi:hypothetical protein